MAPCACGTSKTKSAPGSFTVDYPDGSSSAYRSEVEAIAAAARIPGATVTPNG